MNIKELKAVYTANLRTLRTQKKLSQAEISEKVHITEKFYSDLETGRKWGSFETIVDLANAFGVEPYELFLPAGSVISHNERRTKDLMKRLRANFSELVDTMEDFLKD
ncbi:MAG: helix-turn-helix transcriptional regulator [Treponema porcinum]|uniref:helix-turn-helix domain-containing protein n=1 Tax=Treponema porcinum TaxID=261392 RepID=UPI002A7F669F|nr:helix-turn-helix transcriptional regulator [Treponema porcinum]MDD7612123.1 helix-turn-helix transcriptional regulator [Spirochaetales bacterium]MDY5048223.1 helix-turn-helix transcriptional regulator [Treponema porcinum]MDY5914162.1 helix-turn-helix transcriptional regulator [Treponema sp.]